MKQKALAMLGLFFIIFVKKLERYDSNNIIYKRSGDFHRNDCCIAIVRGEENP